MLSLGVNAVGLTNDRMLSPTRAIIDGRETILAGTNNYMGITFDPDCIAAGKKALDEFGTGTTGSRIANGTFALHTELEREIADFLGRKHCIVFTTGYQANLGMMPGSRARGTPSTSTPTRIPRSTTAARCRAPGSCASATTMPPTSTSAWRAASRGGRPQLVVLEGIYSMLGDRAPLADFVEVKKKHGFQLLVDEAHSFGVLGANGRGLADEAGLEDEVDFIVGTFSKSVGSIGGFGAGNHPLFETLRFAMRAYMFTASSSPATVATSRAALRKLAAEPRRRRRLAENSAGCSRAARRWGSRRGATWQARWSRCAARTSPRPSPCGTRCCRPASTSTSRCRRARRKKLCLLRCSVSAAHTDEDLDRIIALFGEVVAQGHGKKAVNGEAIVLSRSCSGRGRAILHLSRLIWPPWRRRAASRPWWQPPLTPAVFRPWLSTRTGPPLRASVGKRAKTTPTRPLYCRLRRGRQAQDRTSPDAETAALWDSWRAAASRPRCSRPSGPARRVPPPSAPARAP